ncbi:MAG: hypothetical protein GXP54_09430 [Deltaproteobacteria bacterium]|nr:hypothetical protein [Deltaproteobacteria bacterium]
MSKTTAKRSLDRVFRPRAVAVIGASRKRHQIGNEVVRNLVGTGFTGPVYPVNPTASVVHSMHCYPKVTAIPGPVDMAVITVPARYVIDAVKDCAKKKVKGLVVITAGFAEVGGRGAELQAELVDLCAKHGIRIVGPNCMGVLNMEPAYSMNASFASTTPEFGGAAFVSQSGALGEAILADAHDLGLGLHMFVSVGNRADIAPYDLLEYWGDDDGVDQILMYLESFGDPERFMKAARRVTGKKPVMVVKAGRSPRGAMAAASHTGSLAGSEAAVDSLFRQCGVLRVDNMKDLFALAGAAQAGKFPRGNRVAIVTNAGGPAILATDACAGLGLEIVDLEPRTRKRLLEAVPPEASVKNPVDLIASADAERYDKALEAVLADTRVDMVLAIFVSPVMIDSAAVARTIVKHASQSKKPVLACLLGKLSNESAIDILRHGGIPNYRYPEEAATALAGLHRLQEARDRSYSLPRRFRVDRDRARKAVGAALASGRQMMKGTELFALFSSYGIPVVPTRIVNRIENALSFADEVGFPVVAKVEAPDIIHKTDTGGVIVDIRTREELLEAYTDLEKRFRKEHPRMEVMVQAMRKDGVEVFFGAAPDPQYGRLMAFGLGGIHVEVLKDVVFRIHPLTRGNAETMVDGIRARQMLDGTRGKPPVDRAQLADILLRLSQMLTDIPEIAELDVNPFLAAWNPKESCVLDCRVRLEKRDGS